MKAFEEWDNKANPGHSYKAGREYAWRAALKWVLENGELLHTHYACGKSTHEIITEELSND